MERGSTQRIESLTDGVFAIVMTLLVLQLSIPLISGTNVETALSQRLLDMWPKYLTYVVTFVMLGLFWLYHQNLFEYIKRIHGRALWLNLFFLMTVSLLPFTASLVAVYWGKRITAVVYGVNMMLPFLMLRYLFLHATKHGLLDKDIDLAFVHTERRAAQIIFVIMSLGIIIAFFSPIISLLVYGALGVFFLITSWLGREGLQIRRPES